MPVSIQPFPARGHAGMRFNWAHPLAKYLRAYYIFNERAGTVQNLVNPHHAGVLTGANATWDRDQNGSGVKISTQNNGSVVFGRGPAVDNLNDGGFAYELYCTPSASSSSQVGRIVSKSDSSSTSIRSEFNMPTAGALEYLMRTTGIAVSYISNTSHIFAGETMHLIATGRTADVFRIFKNGVEVAYSSSQAGTGVAYDDATVDLMFGNRGSNNRGFQSTVYMLRVWAMVIDAPTAAYLAANIY